jgi:hypothetical protein
MSPAAITGVSDHGGWGVLVTADGNGRLLDRRCVELVDEGLPLSQRWVHAPCKSSVRDS